MNAKIIWLITAILYITPFIISVPGVFNYLSTECAKDSQCLLGPNSYPDFTVIQAAGLTTTSVAAYQVALALIAAAIFIFIGFFIVWHKPNERMAVFVSLTLLTLGANIFAFINRGSIFTYNYPALRSFIQIEAFFMSIVALLTIFIFPVGHFFPRWTRWLFTLGLFNEIIHVFVPEANLTSVSALAKFGLFVVLVGGIVFVQIYRFRHLSAPTQRQQTKWVVYGLTVAAIGYAITSTILPFMVGEFLNSNVFGFLINISAQYQYLSQF